MSVNVVYDVWNELRRYLPTTDRSEAAAALVAVLVDNDYDAKEIRTAFKDDKDIRHALQSYIDDPDSDQEEEFEDYDEDAD